MCGRFYIASEDTAEELQAIIDAVNRKVNGAAAPDASNNPGAQMRVKTSGEIFPTDVVPVLAGNQAVPMRWGFGLGARRIINARSETAADKPLFTDSMARLRCLIPASGYFEWEKAADGKLRHRLAGARGVIYMAGLYRFEPGVDLPTFVILTRASAPRLSYIHDRMPVILDGGARRAWLAAGNAREIIAEAGEEVIDSVG